MNLDFDSLSDAEILAVIRRAGAVPKKGDTQLQRYPVNPNRKDTARRFSLRIWVGNEATIHLTVGRGLADTHRKAVAFHRHNPDIAARPLFIIRHAGVDFFGQECPGLFNLDEALASRRIDTAGWRQAVARVASALATTSRPSDHSSLLRECTGFEETVLSLDSFTKVDAVFLRDTVFPLIRLEASRRPLLTAWSNGDFVAKNIMLDAQGRPRLVDCEFAGRTHFPSGDWFRLRHFSPMPAETTVADLGGPPELPAWLEIRGWLEHAQKMHAVCAPDVVQADLPKISGHLVRLIEAGGGTRSRPVFFDLHGSGNGPQQELPASYEESLTVEWSGRPGDRVKVEPPVPLRPGEWNELQVDLSAPPGRLLLLRLRLPEAPCMLEFRRIEVYGREKTQVLWTAEPDQFQVLLSCTGNLLDLATADGLGIVHFGGESHVSLPPIRISRMHPTAGVSLWVRFVPRLHDFAQAMRRSAAEGGLPAILGSGQALLSTADAEAKLPIAQFFPPAGNAYLEDHSTRFQLSSLHSWNELAFEVPPQPEGAVLRLDPSDQPGLCDLSSLSLGPLPEGNSPSHRHSRDWLAGIRCEGDSLLLPGEEGIRILIFGPDPILKLSPIPSDLAGRKLQLKACLRHSATAPLTAWAAALKEKHSETINLNIRLHQAATLASANAQESARLGAAHLEAHKTIAEFKAALADSQTERINLQRDLETKDAGSAQLVEALSLAGQQTDALKRDLASQQAASAEARTAEAHRAEILATTAAELQVVREQLAETEVQYAEVFRARQSEQQQNIQERAAAAAETIALQQQLQEIGISRDGLRTTAEKLEEALRDAGNKIEQLDRANRQLQATLGSERGQAANQQDRQVVEIESLRREIQSLREQLEREAKARQQAVTSVAAAQAGAEKLRADLVYEQVRANTSTAENTRLTSVLAEFRQRLSDFGGTLATREGELAKARAENEAQTRDILELGRNSAQLTAELAQARDQTDRQAREAAQLREELVAAQLTRTNEGTRLQQFLEEAKAVESSLHAELKDAAQTNQAAQAELTRLRSELDASAREISARLDESRQEQAALRTLKHELSQCRNKLDEREALHRESLQAMESRLEVLREKKTGLLESLYAQNTQIDTLRHRLAAAAQERDRRVAELSAELADTRALQARLQSSLEQQHARLAQDLRSSLHRNHQLEAGLEQLRARMLLRLDSKARDIIDSALHHPPVKTDTDPKPQ